MLRTIGKSSGYLFSSRELRHILDERSTAWHSEIEGFDSDRILNTAQPDLAQYFVEKYTLEAPELLRDEMTADEQETHVDVSHEHDRFFSPGSGPHYIPGQRIEIEIPFNGERELFYARASQFNLNPPRAQVRGQSLFLDFSIPHDSERDIRPEIDRILGEIKQHLDWVCKDVDSFNRSIARDAEAAIESRRERILANQGRVSALGIPLKKRGDSPSTYAVPTVRRKVAPKLPPASTVPYKPEPILDMDNYEHILGVVQSMAQVMERSPSAFESMGEEDLRQHFLVQLNGHFEGKATGETFNFGGKTDILLRENDRNVFIAECKFWKGPKHYRETIDQLLGYTAWRDSKTAILVFNRGTGLSTVLDGIKRESEGHANYKCTVDWQHETGFRYTFHQNNDVNRELTLTVLVFDVPAPESE